MTEPLLLTEPHQENAEKPQHFPVAEQLGILTGIMLLLLGTPQIPVIINAFSDQESEEVQAEQVVSTEAAQVASFYADLNLGAASVFVWDVKEQKALYTKNADERLPLASITKLMTALLVHEVMGERAPVAITLDGIRQEGESGFSDGEEFITRDLLDLTLITSSNDGAYTLAAAAGNSVIGGDTDGLSAFIEAMNKRARDIGLTRTTFKNPTGLDISETESGAYGSARDVSYLMEYIIQNYPQILERTTLDTFSITDQTGVMYQATNTNSTTQKISGMIASKTGYTNLAGGNLVIAFDAGLNHPVVITVLGSTADGRFKDVEELAAQTRAYLNAQ